MLIIPAIDLQDGCVVRLVQGKFDKNKKVYSRDPLKTARHWVKAGAQFLHIVDLDGAYSGTPKNLKLVEEIVRNVDVPIEFGGGVRKIETISFLLGLGIKRVVLGTKAIEDKAFLKKAFTKFKDKVIVSLDVKQDSLLTKGWRTCNKGVDILAFALYLKEIGFKQLIYTDTLKDGTLKGPNIKGIKSLLKDTGLKIIASGGISTLQDLYNLKKLEKQGLQAVIVGKALYDGKFTLSQAMRLA